MLGFEVGYAHIHNFFEVASLLGITYKPADLISFYWVSLLFLHQLCSQQAKFQAFKLKSEGAMWDSIISERVKGIT